MKEIEFKVPPNCDFKRAAALIERICAQCNLELAMKGTLSKYRGCIHWHYKQSDQKGTLEITLYATAHRLWAKVQEGRNAPWIEAELPALRRAIERGLKKARGAPIDSRRSSA